MANNTTMHTSIPPVSVASVSGLTGANLISSNAGIINGPLVTYAANSGDSTFPSLGPVDPPFKTLSVTKLHTLNPCAKMHISVWKALNPTVPSTMVKFEDYGQPLMAEPSFLAFSDSEASAAFDKWYNDYQLWFGDQSVFDTMYPYLPEGSFEGTLVVDTTRSHSALNPPMHTTALRTSEWSWIITNCSRPVYRIESGWIFSKQSDAVMYKLRFSDNRE